MSRFTSGRSRTSRFKACSCCFLVERSADRLLNKWALFSLLNVICIFFSHVVRKRLFSINIIVKCKPTTEQPPWGVFVGGRSGNRSPRASLSDAHSNCDHWTSGPHLLTHISALKTISTSTWNCVPIKNMEDRALHVWCQGESATVKFVSFDEK